MRLYRDAPDNSANGGKYTVFDNRTGKQAKGEFFCLSLRDRFAQDALRAYALAAYQWDQEFGQAVMDLAQRSGPNHPDCKFPD